MSEDLREYEGAARAIMNQYGAPLPALGERDLRAAKACIEAWLAERKLTTDDLPILGSDGKLRRGAYDGDREDQLRFSALSLVCVVGRETTDFIAVAEKFYRFLKGDQPAE